MKLLKMFWHGVPLEIMYPNAHWFQKVLFKVRKFVRKLVILGVLGAIVATSGSIGAVLFSSSTVIASEPQVIEKVVDAPVLERIADCESGNGKSGTGKQFKANGDVVTNTNVNGTVDVGKYQINMSAEHIRLAARLSFNPLTEEGNKAMAQYIYANEGTGPWASSAHCWIR